MGDVGGNLFGFYGAQFGPNSEYIVGHGFTGALHIWKRTKDADGLEDWTAVVSSSGHVGPVMDLTFDTTQSYLLSTSQDQTTRVQPETETTYHIHSKLGIRRVDSEF